MNQCLKCGKKPAQHAVFCNECLEVMERYPVKPGTVIHLPKRPNLPSPSTKEFEEPNLAARVADQRKLIHRLTSVIAGLSVLLVILSVLLMHTLDNQPQAPAIGKNYTTATKP